MFRSLLSYYFSDYFRSHRYITPLLFYITFLVGLYTQTNQPVLDSYAISSIILYVFAAWFSFGFIDLEEDIQQQLTILNIKNQNIYYISKVVFMKLFILILNVIAILYPILGERFDRSVNFSDIINAFLCHFILGLLGIVLGFLFNSRLFRNRKMAIVTLILTIILSIIKSNLVEMIPMLKWLLFPLLSISFVVNSLINPMKLMSTMGIYIIASAYNTILIYSFIKLMKNKMF